MAAFRKTVLLAGIMVAASAAATSAAYAEDESVTVASGYFFVDFNDMASDNPIANFSTNFQAPLESTGNLWVQVGEDEIAGEIDLTFSRPITSIGPVSCEGMAGVYWTPGYDNLTIPTAQLSCSVDVFGLTVSADSQWYWDDFEDRRTGIAVNGDFELTENVSVDFEVGASEFDNLDGTPAHLTIGLPITGDELTFRPFGTLGWGAGNGTNLLGGVTVSW